MSGDWLFDQRGAPDPEVARLERALARYRHVPEPLAEPAGAPARSVARRRWPGLLAAAVVVLLVAALAAWWRGRGGGEPGRAPGAYVVRGLPGVDALPRGGRLETGAGERARVELGAIGHLEVEPGSALVAEEIAPDAHHLYLERGRIEASVVAPPRLFQVGTPAGRSIDLGCAYTLDVDADGRSVLAVTRGQVEFVHGEREVFVPAGARLEATPDEGPGWPVFASASPRFLAALALLGGKGKFDPVSAAENLVDAAEREDTLTLFHAFDDPRTDPEVAATCLRALLRTFPLPAGVSAEGLRAGNRAMRLAWRRSMEPAWR